MKKRIYLSICLASLITLILTSVLAAGVMYSSMTADLHDEVKHEAVFMAAAIDNFTNEKDIVGYVSYSGKNTENRISLIKSDGTVLYDNYADISGMDNHLDRPEIKSAIENGTGEITRSSDTIGIQTYYYAVKLKNGDMLRIAADTKNVIGLLGVSAPQLIIIVLITFIAAMITAKLLTDSIVKPINELDLDEPAANVTYDELSPLLVRMDKQNEKIRTQMEELSKQQNEFEYITENMSEGLVIFGTGGRIISANRSAKFILGTENAVTYTELCHDTEYIDAVNSALSGKQFTGRIEKGERVYGLSANPVDNSPGHGAVLFITDITERENSEKMRREFSANVSHELKTPLTSIMGAAEIIGNGIAKSEDIPHFADQIHTEASRLLTLIRDIIKLSQLDENSIKAEFENVNIKSVCEDVISELEDKADKKNVAISFEGSDMIIRGIRPVLHEMIYNLCDNAIVYNKENGSVKIELSENDRIKMLAVSDTGIGIAPEHQSRIFERFYRVDKSRSKATGGTGLGLSIVKHGAMLHGGNVSVESRVNEGTKVTVLF